MLIAKFSSVKTSMIRVNVNFFCVLLGVSLAALVPVSILNANCFLALLLREKEILPLRQSRNCMTVFSKPKVEISENVSLDAWY